VPQKSNRPTLTKQVPSTGDRHTVTIRPVWLIDISITKFKVKLEIQMWKVQLNMLFKKRDFKGKDKVTPKLVDL